MALLSPSLSPAITIKEIDLSGVAPNVSTSVGAFVGNFRWGPVNSQTLVADESGLVRAFAAPNEDNAVDFHSASYFLKYTNSLYIVRGNNGGRNAHSAVTKIAGDSAVVENREDWETNVSSSVAAGTLKLGSFIAKYPGSLGNALSVSFCPSTDSDGADYFNGWSYKGSFDRAPTTSAYATENGAEKDEVHVAVIDRTGSFTGTPGTVLETFPHLSVAKGAVTPDGSPNYISDVLNTQSEYVWNNNFADDSAFGSLQSNIGQNWGKTPSVDSAVDYSTGSSAWTDSNSKIVLGGGVAGDDLENSHIMAGFDLFDDAESIQVDFLIPPQSATDSDATTIANYLNAIEKDRKDCVVPVCHHRNGIVGVTTSTANTNAISFANSVSSSSYLIVDNNYLKVFDKYNDQYIYIPANSSTAGIMAATDFVAAPWFSPAGQQRGILNNAVKLSYNPTKAQRDLLYTARVNPILAQPGTGVLLFGDKTGLSFPSAFDRINVRRLFLTIEQALERSAQAQLFELNDQTTRANFVNIVEPFLRDVQAKRGIIDFTVICDETNNTPDVVDNNEFRADIFIKPTKSINYITLTFVATRSGVSFEEVAGRV